ncbi:hypothetical protein FIU83_06440 [Halomonas sp. THAF5a]|nr:hypothetical protein [Halomonas sp. THAF5a]QFU01274.1 hypothetical protein FIU83_06440 [Halomonas sp. THAF5a]
MSDTKAQPEELVQVTLHEPHTHNGERHEKGAKLKVRPDQVERLKKHKKI